METKTFLMPETVHRIIKQYAANKGKTMVYIIEEAVMDYINKNPMDNSPNIVRLEKQNAGRPTKKLQSFIRCADEINVMKAQGIPDRVPEDEPSIIFIKYDQRGIFFDGMNNQTMVLICILMAKDNGNMLAAEKLDYLLKFDGKSDCIEVRCDGDSFYPLNETAKMLMAIQPGREYFDKYFLYYAKTIGDFTVKYLY